MNLVEMMRSLGETVGGGATVRNVYGDPVTSGDRTVVPVASVKYAFGGGGGTERGGGGGGRAWAKPCGYVEISPAGTRYVPIHDGAAIAAAVAVGVAIGAALVWARR
jgi:uncharacterized spore protein YtfJ